MPNSVRESTTGFGPVSGGSNPSSVVHGERSIMVMHQIVVLADEGSTPFVYPILFVEEYMIEFIVALFLLGGFIFFSERLAGFLFDITTKNLHLERKLTVKEALKRVCMSRSFLIQEEEDERLSKS